MDPILLPEEIDAGIHLYLKREILTTFLGAPILFAQLINIVFDDVKQLLIVQKGR